jgi:hypothetical protein
MYSQCSLSSLWPVVAVEVSSFFWYIFEVSSHWPVKVKTSPHWLGQSQNLLWLRQSPSLLSLAVAESASSHWLGQSQSPLIGCDRVSLLSLAGAESVSSH